MKTGCSYSWLVHAAFILLLHGGVPGRAAADMFYGVSGAGMNTSQLFTINSTTGTATLVGSIKIGGQAVNVTGITFDPVNHLLYGSAIILGPPAQPAELVTINTATGAATPVHVGSQLFTSLQAPPTSNFTALAYDPFDPSGHTLFGYLKVGNTLPTNTSESLFTVNITTGTASRVGGSGLSTSGDGLAVSPLETIFLSGKGAAGALSTLDHNTGLASTFATLHGGTTSSDQMKGLLFDGNTLFGLDFNMNTMKSRLVTINLTTSPGAISYVDPNASDTLNGIQNLAFDSPTTTPEPGSLTLAGLAAGVFSVYSAARRRRAMTGKVPSSA